MRFSAVFSTLLVGSLAAEDIAVRDLRLEIGGAEGPSQVDDNYSKGPGSAAPSGTYHTKMNAQTTESLRLSFIDADLHRRGGFVWGGGLAALEGKLSIQGSPSNPTLDNLRYATVGIFAFAGYGHSIGSRTHWEIGPFLGLGGAAVKWYDASPSTYSSNTGRGSYEEIGIKGGAFYRLAGHFVIGVTAGYLHSDVRASVDFPNTGGHSDLSFSTDSGMIAASAAIRL